MSEKFPTAISRGGRTSDEGMKKVEQSGQASFQKQQERFAEKDRMRFEAVQNALARINPASLRTVLEKYLVRSGVPKESINFFDGGLKLYGISDASKSFAVAYMPETNSVAINAAHLDILDETHDIPALQDSLYLEILRLMTHELVHATGHVAVAQFVEQRNDATVVQRVARVGYAIAHKQSKIHTRDGSMRLEHEKPVAFFNPFNEGVVDAASWQVLLEYLDEAHYGNDTLRTQITENLKRMVNHDQYAYTIPVAFAQKVAEKVGEYSGFDKTAGWRSLVASHFLGDELMNPALQEEFDYAIGKNFIAILSTAKTNEDLKKIAKDFGLGELSKENALEFIQALELGEV